MRGLAVGILLTTIILTIANAGNKPLTDAQIKQRAVQLGMVEGDSLRLSSLQNGSDQSTGESAATKESAGKESSSAESSTAESGSEASTAETKESGATESAAGSSAAGSAAESTEAASSAAESSEATGSSATGSTTESSAASSTAESSVTASSTSGVSGDEDQTSDRPVTIEIQSGASSYTVSQALAAAGLVEDARKFDDYLCDNGYASKIHIGVYEILPGTSEKEIANMIAY